MHLGNLLIKRIFVQLNRLNQILVIRNGAAGIASVIKASLCLQHKKLVPSINFDAGKRKY